jgi:uncharacterized membrane protein YoaK (UPF0700 family)
VSYLSLGHVFVANMTGNVVFLGFAPGGTGSRLGRRLLAVAAMFLGALIGALLALDVSTFAPLAVAAAILVVVAVGAQRLARSGADWSRAR